MMEYRLKLNKKAIERFYLWGNVAMCVEALGLLLWVTAVLFLFRKSFIEFFIWFGCGALLLFLPIVFGITKFASARKLRNFQTVIFWNDRIELKRDGSSIAIPFSEIRMSFIQKEISQIFHGGRCDLFSILLAKPHFFVFADVFFENPVTAQIAFQKAKKDIDHSHGFKSVLTAYTMYLAYETPEGEKRIGNPSREQIETAIRALDADRCTLVSLTAGNAGTLLIGGGNGQYILTALFENGRHLTARKSTEDSTGVELTVGGQTGIYSSNEIWTSDVAVHAAWEFVENGRLEPALHWTEP